MNYLELYNATEGFFGIQDQRNSDELLLMLDYGIYYEFIKASDVGQENPKTVRLDEVELDVNYAPIILRMQGFGDTC